MSTALYKRTRYHEISTLDELCERSGYQGHNLAIYRANLLALSVRRQLDEADLWRRLERMPYHTRQGKPLPAGWNRAAVEVALSRLAAAIDDAEEGRPGAGELRVAVSELEGMIQ